MLAFILVTLILSVCAVSIGIYAKRDETQKADAAIILGYSVEDDQPTPAFQERIHHGIRLYEQGYVRYLIFTGGIGEGDTVSEAQAAKEYALSLGVPEDVILVEDQSRITEENLEFSKVIMEQHGLNTALLVSDPLHMKRAMLMAKDYGVTAYASPTATSVHRDFKQALPFIGRESVAYAYYRLIRLF